jgi:hypothetical protein
MTRSSRLLLPLALFVLAASLAGVVPSARATDPFPTTGVWTLTSKYFTSHVSRDVAPCPAAAITQEQAGDMLGMADNAYDFYASLGYTAPVGLTDISVDDLDLQCVPYGTIPMGVPLPIERWDALIEPLGPPTPPQPDNIHVKYQQALSYHIIAHEVFHVFEDAVVPAADPWLKEGIAEWAATRAEGAVGGVELNPDRTMDCVGSECGDSEFDRNGYPGWMLFEYLAERFGDAKVKDVLIAGGSMNGTHALASVVQPLGPTLGKFFEDYTTRRLTGSLTSPLLAGVLPTTQATIVAPTTTDAPDLDPVTLAVNHLAVRYVDIAHAAADDTSPCFNASLALKVALPTGVPSTPYYYANTKGSSAQAFSVSGSTASLTVPWNTCAGSPHAYVSLPNESNDVAPPALDGRQFTVSGTITIDKSSPASASEAPTPVKVIGPVVSVPTSDPAPDLTLYAPELIRVSSKTRVLRFVIFSDGSGTLKATIGNSWLGSANLHAGNNDLRFVLPSQLLKTLKKTSAPSNLLTVTSFSAGGSQGESLTRHVAIQTVKKPVKKPAKKTKKPKKHR